MMWKEYYTPTRIDKALELIAALGPTARIIAGGTDLMLEIESNTRRPDALVDITRIGGLDEITQDADQTIHLGPLVTHSQVIASDLVVREAFPLAQACRSIGAPEIRNRGTVAGNLVTASPANDTIPALVALGATVTCSSLRGQRHVPLGDFFRDVRRTALADDEILTDTSFPAMRSGVRGVFLKFGLRRALAVSVASVAAVLAFDGDRIERAAIALGSVAPTVIRATAAEEALIGRRLVQEVVLQAAQLAANAAKPIDDIRASAAYRRELTRVLTARALRQLASATERDEWPARPVVLWGRTDGHWSSWDEEGTIRHGTGSSDAIWTTINGEQHWVLNANAKTLLRMLREDVGLTGTKGPCAEGECGGCTVLMDGMPVLACLVPAPRAHRASILTIESLARDSLLDPVQQAFVESGAVQCGFCTPGVLVSARALVDQGRELTDQEILEALSGHLCRCTGYGGFVKAVKRTRKTEY